MKDSNILLKDNGEPQCLHYVLRKKRLCRMTVRPGKQYCGEHEPQPTADDDQDTKRIPCPNDPKHTCYASKLEKHLKICNARQQGEPDYMVRNVNLGPTEEEHQHLPLTQVPPETIRAVVDKINSFYNEHLIQNITEEEEKPIHSSMMEEFSVEGRSESSLRHLRQVSSLLHLAEAAGLVQPNTCYIDLGAGKGQLGVYACRAWGVEGGGVVLLERAALRHKRDRLAAAPRGPAAPREPAALTRLRHDLAHVSLARVPAVRAAEFVVGLAKHLCGAATDMALRALAAADVAEGVGGRVAGAVLATCCHHRVHPAHYVAARTLQAHGFDAEELDVVLGVVSWATCGDGRPRGAGRAAGAERAGRAETGRRAKALLDWGRVQYLRERGFSAWLVRYVSGRVTPENVAIVATRAPPPLPPSTK